MKKSQHGLDLNHLKISADGLSLWVESIKKSTDWITKYNDDIYKNVEWIDDYINIRDASAEIEELTDKIKALNIDLVDQVEAIKKEIAEKIKRLEWKQKSQL